MTSKAVDSIAFTPDVFQSTAGSGQALVGLVEDLQVLDVGALLLM